MRRCWPAKGNCAPAERGAGASHRSSRNRPRQRDRRGERDRRGRRDRQGRRLVTAVVAALVWWVVVSWWPAAGANRASAGTVHVAEVSGLAGGGYSASRSGTRGGCGRGATTSRASSASGPTTRSAMCHSWSMTSRRRNKWRLRRTVPSPCAATGPCGPGATTGRVSWATGKRRTRASCPSGFATCGA